MAKDVIKAEEVEIGGVTYTIQVEAIPTGYTAQAYCDGKPYGVPLSASLDEFIKVALCPSLLDELADSLIHCVHGFLLGNFVRNYMKALKEQGKGN
jgi:hypothetical protein